MHCRCGQRHWGRYGAAGLLLADDAGHVVLQHRAPWSHHGDTWGIPGGARNRDESAVAAAVREAGEEAGVTGPVSPHATYALVHPDWSYTTVVARTSTELPVRATDHESVEVRWHPIDDVARLPLLAAFAQAWPVLQEMLRTRAVLVVDAANVVGARPDGWWQDRAGATTRLARRLARLTEDGAPADLLDLPGHTWWPQVVLVTEGKARAAAPVPGVHTVAADGSGDDAIVDAVTHLLDGTEPGEAGTGETGRGEAATNAQAPHVRVITADRALQQRVRTAGATVQGPRKLWQVLDALPDAQDR